MPDGTYRVKINKSCRESLEKHLPLHQGQEERLDLNLLSRQPSADLTPADWHPRLVWFFPFCPALPFRMVQQQMSDIYSLRQMLWSLL